LSRPYKIGTREKRPTFFQWVCGAPLILGEEASESVIQCTRAGGKEAKKGSPSTWAVNELECLQRGRGRESRDQALSGADVEGLASIWGVRVDERNTRKVQSSRRYFEPKGLHLCEK